MTGVVRTGSTPPKTKIFVGRLPEDAKSSDLKRLFEQYGTVTECDILNRYGFVHMKTEDMAARAIRELNNSEFMGVRISVEQSTGKKGGGGGGGGRGRGGFGPMRGRGGPMRGGMGRTFPYSRDGRGDYDRRSMDSRPGLDRMGPPMGPPSMRNGYYDSYDRGGYDGYYSPRGPAAPPMMSSREREMMFREPERPRPYPESSRDLFERRPLPPLPSRYEREGPMDYGSRMSSDMYRRRSPPPQSPYERDPVDSYGLASRRYAAGSPLDRDMPPRRY